MTERVRTSEMSNSERIGVWVENGVVYRRDSAKQVFLSIYEPESPEDLNEVLSLARILHAGATMDNWTAQVEAQQSETARKLDSLIIRQD